MQHGVELTDYPALKKAFFFGLGIPSLIHTGATAYSDIQYRNAIEQRSSVLMSAYAAYGDVPYGDTGTDHKHNIIVKVIPDKNMPAYAVNFFTANKLIYSIGINHSLDTAQEVIVPESADRLEIAIVGENSKSNAISLPKNQRIITISVKLEKNYWSGFFQALGFLRTSVYKITISLNSVTMEGGAVVSGSSKVQVALHLKRFLVDVINYFY